LQAEEKDILVQIEIFDEELRNDAVKLQKLQAERQAAEDTPDKIVATLWRKSKETKSDEIFFKVTRGLLHLGLLRDDPKTIWEIIDKFLRNFYARIKKEPNLTFEQLSGGDPQKRKSLGS